MAVVPSEREPSRAPGCCCAGCWGRVGAGPGVRLWMLAGLLSAAWWELRALRNQDQHFRMLRCLPVGDPEPSQLCGRERAECRAIGAAVLPALSVQPLSSLFPLQAAPIDFFPLSCHCSAFHWIFPPLQLARFCCYRSAVSEPRWLHLLKCSQLSGGSISFPMEHR